MLRPLNTESLRRMKKSGGTGESCGDEEFMREEMRAEYRGRACPERRCRGKTRWLWSQMHQRWERGN